MTTPQRRPRRWTTASREAAEAEEASGDVETEHREELALPASEGEDCAACAKPRVTFMTFLYSYIIIIILYMIFEFTGHTRRTCPQNIMD